MERIEALGSDPAGPKPGNGDFIREIIAEEKSAGKHAGGIVTRFPPEPNGYLHIGHAKSICLNFGIAIENSGRCHLRFDDTNPVKEDIEYIESIRTDVRWLGFDWGRHEYFASDYFEKLYNYAEQLIAAGKAYVCDLSQDEIREYRGSLTAPGKESPYRNRTAEENLSLFRKMRAGGIPDGKCVLRAKIDMASPNLDMRDPAMYRIKHVEHHRTGPKWCIYPMYDFAHCLSDAIEGITHSICTLEFEDNRQLYDWFLDNLGTEAHPRQIEFARLNITYTVLSKRKLLLMVQKGIVSGWDDPRMPTLSGLRRRGYAAEAIRNFTKVIGVSKKNSNVDIQLLEHCQREHLNKTAARAMAVLAPLKLVIENYPEGKTEWMDAENNPEDPTAGRRQIPFSRVLFIEKDDFLESPPPKFFRLAPGREVRLKHAYYVTCTGVEKDEKTGEITEVRCTYDPASRGGGTPDNRKVQGTLHWVSAPHAVHGEVRLYDYLFTRPDPDNVPEGSDFLDALNPGSLKILKDCLFEPSLARAAAGTTWQFLRLGYFSADPDSASGRPVFNRTVTLKDSWARIEKKR